MKLRVKDEGADASNDKDTGVRHFPWEGGLQAIAAGAAEAYQPEPADRGPDQPGAQSPAPGVDPVGRKEAAAHGTSLTNVDLPAGPARAAGGLPSPKDAEVRSTTTAAPKVTLPVVQAKPDAKQSV